jgi:hypothetical protein
MYERDKNFPCVIGWSLGNECGYGPTHKDMHDWLRLRDPLRFVQYESGGARTPATDVICPMYTPINWCVENALHDAAKRPVILCEYAHAMGNSGGALTKYWQHFRDPKYPRFQGGFIWDWCDQGLLVPEVGKGYLYGGDFGDLPNTKQFCINGITNPDRVPHPDALEASFLQSPIDVNMSIDDSQTDTCLTIVNRRVHTDLSDLVIVITPYYQSVYLGKCVKFHSIEWPCESMPVSAGNSYTRNITGELTLVIANKLKEGTLSTVGFSFSSPTSPVPLYIYFSSVLLYTHRMDIYKSIYEG